MGLVGYDEEFMVNIYTKFQVDISSSFKVIGKCIFWSTQNLRKLDRYSVENLCRPWVLCQKKKSKYKKGHNSIKCDLDLKNLTSSSLSCHKQHNFEILMKKY
jgi:hypothetical protein